MTRVKLGKKKFPLPGSPVVRIVLGTLCLIGGVLGFLPILGFWMIPLGVVILSVDVPVMRKLRRKVEARWGRRKQAKHGG